MWAFQKTNRKSPGEQEFSKFIKENKWSQRKMIAEKVGSWVSDEKKKYVLSSWTELI